MVKTVLDADMADSESFAKFTESDLFKQMTGTEYSNILRNLNYEQKL